MKIKSETKQKILLLLLAGVALGFTRSPKSYFRLLKGVKKGWKEIERRKLARITKEFYRDKLVDYKEKKDGTVEVILTKDGKQRAIRYKIDEMEIKKPKKWDKKWRVVIFDIPEKKKIARETLRNRLKELGFLELQKSVFIYPYECENEIEFIVEVFNIRSYVRFLRVESFSNEEQYKLRFDLY